eukprot:3447428-Rhodomonas_salina.1
MIAGAYSLMGGVESTSNIRASTDGICTQAGECEMEALTGEVQAFFGANPGLLQCEGNADCMELPGTTTVRFAHGAAVFSDLRLPLLAERGTVLRLQVRSPWTGTFLHKDCPPIDLAPAFPAVLSILTPPIGRADAGSSLPMQPTLLVSDEFDNLVAGAFPVHAAACKPCPCPCSDPTRLLPGGDVFGLPCSPEGMAQSWSALGSVPAVCSLGPPALDGALAQSRRGRVVFERLRVTAAGSAVSLFFFVEGASHVNVTAAPIEVQACEPMKLAASPDTPLSADADTGA